MSRYKKIRNHMQGIILPSVVFSGVTGAVTGALIFAFRVISGYVIEVSRAVFTFANQNPAYIPLVVAGAVLVALFVSLCLSYSPHSRGGGIPTAVALMRGLISFHWLRNIIFVFTSALLSYLCGIPLGNDEGPAVQIGTAVGSGTTRVLGRKHHLAWERYVMTGGATAGFAVATGAPIAAVLFGLEEAHRRFSPLLLMSAFTSVLTGMGTLRALCYLTDFESALFDFQVVEVLPLSLIWVALPIAVLCGIFAYVFAKTTRVVRTLMHRMLKHAHPFFKVAPVFALVALVGCFSYACIGTGHGLIEALLEHRVVWYLALALLLARSVLVILSNDVGATGGLFTPLLVCGALIGSITAEVMILWNVLDSQYFMLLVVIGMASFFSASVRTPLTAAVFSVEVLSGFHNILPIALAVLVSYIIVETIGAVSINEIAMEREVHKERRGKTVRVFDVEAVVMTGSFAIGKEPRDILWPPACQVLSVRKPHAAKEGYGGAIGEGDVLRLYYTTYDPARTAEELCAILGEQTLAERQK